MNDMNAMKSAGIPRWKHDCTQCQFVGRRRFEDVYICDKDNFIEVVIRTSSEGAGYWSSVVFKKSV